MVDGDDWRHGFGERHGHGHRNGQHVQHIAKRNADCGRSDGDGDAGGRAVQHQLVAGDPEHCDQRRQRLGGRDRRNRLHVDGFEQRDLADDRERRERLGERYGDSHGDGQHVEHVAECDGDGRDSDGDGDPGGCGVQHHRIVGDAEYRGRRRDWYGDGHRRYRLHVDSVGERVVAVGHGRRQRVGQRHGHCQGDRKHVDVFAERDAAE